MRILLQYLLGCLNSAHNGHLDVHEHDVRNKLLGQDHRLRAGWRFTHYFHACQVLKERTKTFTKKGMVINYQNSNDVHVLPPRRDTQ